MGSVNGNYGSKWRGGYACLDGDGGRAGLLGLDDRQWRFEVGADGGVGFAVA